MKGSAGITINANQFVGDLLLRLIDKRNACRFRAGEQVAM
jgi:hypothetical protein